MTAERQVGERLSEEPRDRLVERVLRTARSADMHARKGSDGRTGGLVITQDVYELVERLEQQARQLAEAERENGRLRGTVEVVWTHLPLFPENDDHHWAAIREAVAAALNPPDPPVSPAEGPEAATEVEGKRG